jgi:hypothetical protein
MTTGVTERPPRVDLNLALATAAGLDTGDVLARFGSCPEGLASAEVKCSAPTRASCRSPGRCRWPQLTSLYVAKALTPTTARIVAGKGDPYGTPR